MFWTTLKPSPDFENGIGKDGEWKIPISLFTNAAKLSLYYILSGVKEDGKIVWDADYTDFLEITISR